jgi:hypothetical protein
MWAMPWMPGVQVKLWVSQDAVFLWVEWCL